ncbi:hypothetical protein SAMN05421788_10597 [Filimonas lacunae]|uniref:DUF1684 domain-containing protein n=1 Tax=Filimonas lacunae TaxID=477680 RepID=A0A173MD53_9BACT|nr:DUF1684 domain-containing protein [Filimonas lacunae]BAV05450.1 hypothetical protein FLA_1457 [Filimonas lacunae]SIT21067.1 hypothetical protein SAMN05421788_10597 [Filimonas lacunae]
MIKHLLQKTKYTLALLALLVSIKGFSQNVADTQYVNGLDRWHHEREEELKREDGWLSLVGLHWLKEGTNTFGADSKSDIVLPKNFPLAQGGSYTLTKGKVVFHQTSGSIKVANLASADSSFIVGESDRKPVTFTIDGFKWIIIKRQDKYGLRIWDNHSPALQAFKGVPRFPVSTSWKLKATFQPAADDDGFVSFKNKIGQSFDNKPVGKLSFTIGGKQYTLDIVSESRAGYFIVFGDKTSGEQTYASGRFLTVEKADDKGVTYIDFNKAINPPCVFTDYATCPLPPESNVLPVEILAGEKDFHAHH